jgi:hypothetical protein
MKILIPAFVLVTSFAVAGTDCFNEVKQNGKNSEVLENLTLRISNIVEDDLEDDELEVVEISQDQFSYKLDHNNYNTISFYSSSKRFGFVRIKEASGAIVKYFFNPSSRFKLEDAGENVNSNKCKITVVGNEKLFITLYRASSGVKWREIKKTLTMTVSY